MLPIIGYVIFLFIRNRHDYELLDRMPMGVKSRLSSVEAVSLLDDKSYNEYRQHLIHDELIGIGGCAVLAVVGFFAMLIKGDADLADALKICLITFIFLNGFCTIPFLYDMIKLGENDGILKIRCEILKYSNVAGKEHWIMIGFYDLNKMNFRKKRFYRAFNSIIVRDGNYILARHGERKMRIIGLYQEKITPDNVTRVEDLQTGWKVK